MNQYSTRVNTHESVIVRHTPILHVKSPEAWVRDYEAAGYQLLRNHISVPDSLLSNIITQAADYDVLKNYEPNNPDMLRSLLGVHRLPVLNSIFIEAERLARSVLGDDIYVFQSRVNFKMPGGSGWHAHSDFETWHSQDGMPDMKSCTVMIPLTDNTEANGAVEFLSHSHCYFFSCRKSTSGNADSEFSNQTEGLPSEEIINTTFPKKRFEAMYCNRGDAVVFDCNTLHRSQKNNSETPRSNLFFVFNRLDNNITNGKNRPKQMAES